MANIIVAFSKPEDGRNIKNILTKNGLQVIMSCTNGAQVLTGVDDLKGGIIISGFRFGDMTCRQLYHQLPMGFDMLLVASPNRWSGENMGKIVCLAAPFKICDLISSVRLLEQMQLEKHRARKKHPPVRDEGEKRAIEQAKMLLMERHGITEAEAHKYLQKSSMDSGTGMAEAARMALRLYQ